MFSPHSIPSDPAVLYAYLDGRSRKKLAHNTWVTQHVSYSGRHIIEIIYHQTVIAQFTSSGGSMTLMVNDGGWRTVTTKTRINAILGNRGRITSIRRQWYINFGGYDCPWYGTLTLLV